MFLHAQQTGAATSFYGYVNGDIAFDESLVSTLRALRRYENLCWRLLLVGRRIKHKTTSCQHMTATHGVTYQTLSSDELVTTGWSQTPLTEGFPSLTHQPFRRRSTRRDSTATKPVDTALEPFHQQGPRRQRVRLLHRRRQVRTDEDRPNCAHSCHVHASYRTRAKNCIRNAIVVGITFVNFSKLMLPTTRRQQNEDVGVYTVCILMQEGSRMWCMFNKYTRTKRTPRTHARTPGPTHVQTRASTNARTHHVRAYQHEV